MVILDITIILTMVVLVIWGLFDHGKFYINFPKVFSFHSGLYQTPWKQRKYYLAIIFLLVILIALKIYLN